MDKILKQNTRMIILLKGLLLSYIITALMLLLLSFMVLKLDLPGIVVSGIINFSYIVSAFVGGFFTGRKIEQRKFIWGLIMGIMYFVIYLIIALMMNGVAPISFGSLFTVLVISSLSGMLGGMVS